MSRHTHATARRAPAPSLTPVAPGTLQRYGGKRQEELGRMRRGVLDRGPSATVPPIVVDVLRSPGQPLDAPTRAFFEPRFGHDFSGVRVHSDDRAAASARAVHAVAYTVGRDIAFDLGRYDPNTRQGQHLLAHELTHVAQQNRQTPARLDKLSMAQPAGSSEREADRAAAAVIDGASFRPATTNAATLARQVDAGVADAGPRDAPPAAGPRDAPPVAGAPKAPDASVASPPPVAGPAPKAPAVAPPSATFAPVRFDARADRIPPTKTVHVAVTLAGIPANGSAAIDVEGSGGGNGTATITAGAALAASGKVTVKGGAQTAAGNAGKLKLRATVGGSVVGRSGGFTIAAFPRNYTDTFVSDVDTLAALGVKVQDGWSSDGSGAVAELDKVKISERVDLQSRDNPPFTVIGGTSATGGTSGYLAGDKLSKDTHTYERAAIDTSTLKFGTWKIVYGQLCIFKCERTGVADVLMPASGYTITHRVWNLAKAPCWHHQAVKRGAAVTVEGRKATTGGGVAPSKVHNL